MWVVCEHCGIGSEEDSVVALARLKAGEIREEKIEHYDHTQIVRLGECDDCRSKRQVVIEIVVYERSSVAQEQADIMRRMSQLAGRHPNWARERCSAQAVEDHNSPYLESNEGFRAYLLDR